MGRTKGRIDANRTLMEILERLSDKWSAEHGRPLSNQMLSAALGAAGHPVSKLYLSQLRTGHRSNPSTDLLLALACFFEVEFESFFDSAASSSDEDIVIVGRLRDPGLRRLLHMSADLSADTQSYLTRVAELFRAAEGLIEQPTDIATTRHNPRLRRARPR